MLLLSAIGNDRGLEDGAVQRFNVACSKPQNLIVRLPSDNLMASMAGLPISHAIGLNPGY